MPISHKSYAICRFLLLLGISLLLCVPAHGQYNNKKKKKKYKQKADANIISRGYNDVTTRNNYYFNARLLYMDMLADIDLEYTQDYDEILPIYFHQKLEDFSAYEGDLETIIQKTSIVMHLHDNTRWKDNVYLLLGQARYLQGDYYDAVRTFQFIVSTMEEDVAKVDNAVDNKARMKAKKAKEAAKRAKERQKEIDAKKKAAKEVLSKLKRDKEKEMASNSKDKKKQLQKKIKAKQKIIALRKKGKKVPQKLIDIAYGTDEEEETETVDGGTEEQQAGEEEKEEDFTTVKVDYRSDRKIQKEEERKRMEELGYLNDTIAMTEKEAEKFDDLNLWDKIKHKSSRPAALVWLAKSYMKTGDIYSAQSTLEYAEALPKLTPVQLEQIYAGQAYFYLEERRFDNALDALDNAADVCKKKKRSFYHYISAQVREREGDPTEAIEYYRMITEEKADFRMKFYANMKMIHLMEDAGSYPDEYILELLTDLLKNGSNKEFRDQIHYKIAGIYADAGDLDNTIEHLQQSITASRSNQVQKALSFRELGEAYLWKQQYDAASIFYDSAVAVMPTEHETFTQLERRAGAVFKVAEQAKIIAETDSLLLLSGMTEQDLALYIAELENKAKQEARKRRKKGKSVTSFIEEAVTVETGSILTSGDWYFYNQSLRDQGFREFRQIWGDRAYEHNWRRLNKEINFAVEETEEEQAEEELIVETDFSEIREVVAIPSTPEEIEAAHAKLSDAYYAIAKLFRNNLERNGDAKRNFETIVLEYPEFRDIDQVFYYLYLIYSEEGNLAKADHYRDLLMNGYPESQYTYAINHPYVPVSGDEEVRPEPTPVEQLYASTYVMFEEGRYIDVIRRRNEAWITHKGNPLMPQFDFLEALSYGHLDSLSVLKNKLGDIITKYPNHEVETKAKEYLAIINQKENEEGFEDTVRIADETDTTTFVSIYTNEESDNIFGMVVLRDRSIDIRQMIQLLDQYNDTNFKARKLRVSNAYLDKDTPLILIKRFREKSLATEYVTALTGAMEDLFGPEESGNMDLLMITNDNFRTLFTTKKLEEYTIFFDKTYR